MREEKWELYRTQLAATVNTLGQGENNVRGEEKCEEMDRVVVFWLVGFLKKKKR